MAKDAFIQIKNCDGESTDKNHSNWIEIEDWSWGIAQPASAGASTAGSLTTERVTHQPFIFTHRIDAAFPKLIKASCQGAHIPQATVELMRAVGGGNSQLYMKFVMSDLVVTSVGISTDPTEGNLPLGTVQIAYGKIEWTYTQLDHKTGKPSGNITGSHDLESNTVS